MIRGPRSIPRIAPLSLAVGVLLLGCSSEGSPGEDFSGGDVLEGEGEGGAAVGGVEGEDGEGGEGEGEGEGGEGEGGEGEGENGEGSDTGDPDEPPTFICQPFDNCDVEFCDQVLIEGGEFNMGTENEPDPESHWPSGDARPVHLVHVDTYCMAKYEVTLENYENCVDAGICSPAGLTWEKVGSTFETTVNHYPERCYAEDDTDGEVLPVCRHNAVNGKTLAQAKTYCEWVGGRLCTEAEWERAANGPGLEKRHHPWGDDPPTGSLVNIPSVGTGYVEKVSDYAPGASVEGVFNLAGNVFEWTSDAYRPYRPSIDGQALDNPANPPLGQMEMVGRGSCFLTEPTHTVTDRTVFPQLFDWG